MAMPELTKVILSYQCIFCSYHVVILVHDNAVILSSC